MVPCMTRLCAGETVTTLQHESQTHIFHSQQDPNRFDRDRLFNVVSRGVPEELAGLLEYLRRTSKYLTDSSYTGSLGVLCAQNERAAVLGLERRLRG